MEIKTKFNVGDKVVGIGYNEIEEWWEIRYWFVIESICCFYENGKLEIVYDGKKLKIIRGVGEQDCFSTIEQAQKECERRNECKQKTKRTNL